jgi:hypothetical protein
MNKKTPSTKLFIVVTPYPKSSSYKAESFMGACVDDAVANHGPLVVSPSLQFYYANLDANFDANACEKMSLELCESLLRHPEAVVLVYDETGLGEKTREWVTLTRKKHKEFYYCYLPQEVMKDCGFEQLPRWC